MATLKSKVVTQAKSFYKLKEYIIVDLEYQSQDRNRPHAFRPLQVSAVHYKHNKVHGKMLDVFLIDRDEFSLNDISRALSSYTGSTKSFANYLQVDGYSLALKEIYRWFKSKQHDVVPIIVVGCRGTEVERLFELVNTKLDLKRGKKMKTFDVYTIQSLVSSTFNVKFDQPIGLPTFQKELKHVDKQFIVNRDNCYHNALNDVVMTYSLLQYLFVDERTTSLLKLAIEYMLSFKEFINSSNRKNNKKS